MGLSLNTRLSFNIELPMDFLDPEELENLTWTEVEKKLIKAKTYESGEEMFNTFGLEPQLNNYIEVLTKEEIPRLKKNKILVSFIPDTRNSWSRLSDNIDSYLIPESKYGSIQYIHTNIFPFVENKICLNNFTELDELTSRELWLKKWSSVSDKESKRYLKLGFTKKKPLTEQFFMRAPKVIRNLARGIGISEVDLNKIRPALLIYVR